MAVVASGVRIGWPDLPVRVRAWVEQVVGGPVVSHRSQAGGFSPGTADRIVTATGVRAFVKAVSVDQNAHTPDLHRREAAVVAALPPTPRVPALLGRYDDGHWVALVFADVDGRTPTVPWVGAEIDATMDALAELAVRFTPAPVALPTLRDEIADPFGGWARLRADPPADLDPWVAAHLDELVALAADALDHVDGDTVVHVDVRADNLLVGADGQVSVVDWPWASRGAAWVDRLFLLVNVDLYGGHDPDALLRRHLDALVSDDVVDATVAGLCGYFTDAARTPPPPGLPTVRAFQRAQSVSTLAWLRRRLGDRA